VSFQICVAIVIGPMSNKTTIHM